MTSRLDSTSLAHDRRIQDNAESKCNEKGETLKKIAIVAIAAIALIGVIAAFATLPHVAAVGLSIGILLTAGMIILMLLGVKFEDKQHQKEVELRNLHISPDKLAQDMQSPFDHEVPQGLDTSTNS
jgi:flagellar basal body-associated protein FliL